MNEKYVFWGSLSIAGGLLIWLVLNKKPKPTTPNTTTPTTPNTPNTTTTPNTTPPPDVPTLDLDKMLLIGSRGEEVKQLQRLLNQINPKKNLSVDGVFGSLTETALIQESQGTYRQITLRQFYKSFDVGQTINTMTYNPITQKYEVETVDIGSLSTLDRVLSWFGF